MFTRREKITLKLLVLYCITAVCLLFMLNACTGSKRCVKGRADSCPGWTDNIKNPENEEFVVEVAFNLNKPVSQVTQQEFNNRYLNN